MDLVDDSKEGMLATYHDNKAFKTAQIYSGISTNVLKSKLGAQENIVTIFDTKHLQKRSCLRDWLKRLAYLAFGGTVICLLVVILSLNLNKPTPSYNSEEVGALYQLSTNISKKLHLLRIAIENTHKKVPSEIEDIINDLAKDLRVGDLNQVKANITGLGQLQEPVVSPSCWAGWGARHDVYSDQTDFYLAFRATAGTGQSVYEAYRGNGLKVNLEPTCKQVNGSLPCSGHYRNDVILDTWQNIHQVVIALYRGDQLVQSLKFRAAGTNFLSWMAPEHLIHAGKWLSSESESKEFWKSSTNYFNIEGDVSMKRRFFISQKSGGCDEAAGWMAVLDPMTYDRRPCSWELGASAKRPTFLYSPTSASSAWKEVGHADVMAIFVKPFDECIV